MCSKQATVLVVDDERSVADLLCEDLADEGYNCITVDTGEDALMKLSRDQVDIVLLDLRLPGIAGMDVLREIKSIYPGTAVIVITAVGDAQTAVEAMKIGAIDYITKPFGLERVNSSIETALKVAVFGSILAPTGEDAEVGSEEVDWMPYLDFIACGVQTRLDSLTGLTMNRTMVEQTVVVARSLCIPEDQIEKWADAERRRMERINVLDALLDKLQTSTDT